MKFEFFITALFLSVQSFGITSDSIRLEEKRGNYFIIHQVDPGETVYSLAKRYNADVSLINRINRIQNNEINVGQFLEIPYGEVTLSGEIHIVKRGETLFSIARDYGVKVEEIKRWNNLRSNSLSIGQELSIGEVMPVTPVNETDSAEVESDSKEFLYYVQTGETIESIAARLNTTVDSIRLWNDLATNQVQIGQKLIFPFEVEPDSMDRISEVVDYTNTSYGSKIRKKEEGGIVKVYEQGLAKKIDTTFDTDKFLALHRKLKVGSILQVKNMMNNETIYVRIVGKLPDTGLNKNVMIRLTPIAFKRLRIVDDRSLVEINYFEN